MKLLAILLITLAGCASAPSRPALERRITPAQCEAQGGCIFVSMVELNRAVGQAYAMGILKVLEDLDSQGCMRGAL